MTKREGAIIGAYTGILCGSFSALHEYIEEIMCRPVFTHELAREDVNEELKKRSKKDFILMCEMQD